MTYPSAFHRRWAAPGAAADWSNRHSNCNFFPNYKFPITQIHIILYICKYPCVIMCHQIRFESSELSWQLSWDRAPVFSEWPSGGNTSRMSISRLRTTTWNFKLCGPNLEIGAIPRCRTTAVQRLWRKIKKKKSFFERLWGENGHNSINIKVSALKSLAFDREPNFG